MDGLNSLEVGYGAVQRFTAKKGFNAKKGLKTEGVDGNEVLT